MGMSILPVWSVTGRLPALIAALPEADVSRENQSVSVGAGRPSGWLYSGRAGLARGSGDQCGLAAQRGQGDRRSAIRASSSRSWSGSCTPAWSPVIEIADVRPNLMLVAVVLVTALAGFGPGRGLGLRRRPDRQPARPRAARGSAPEPAARQRLVAGGDRLLGRLIWVYPILAAFAGSILADLVILGVLRLMDEPARRRADRPDPAGGRAQHRHRRPAALSVAHARAPLDPEEKPAW